MDEELKGYYEGARIESISGELQFLGAVIAHGHEWIFCCRYSEEEQMARPSLSF